MPAPSIEELVSRVDRILPVPSAAMQVVRLLDLADSSVKDVANALSQDQGLTANVLKLANSAYYGMPRRISLPMEAIALLGFKTIRSIVWASVMEVLYSRPLVGYKLESGALWQHSLAAAAIAKYLGIKFRLRDPESLYVAGLLHDVGKLILNLYLPVEFGRLMALVEQGETFAEAEKEVLGYDHAEVGGAVCEKWQLPDVITQGVRYHHSPKEATNESAHIVHLANAIALTLGQGTLGAATLAASLDEEIVAKYVPTEEAWERLLDEAREQVILVLQVGKG
ncbi:HDOD domain-containing protein [Coprothermobacteraceae bacterium]|nr:HDOD domain-containing protein [Coprothermobacteraceae bacterium]